MSDASEYGDLFREAYSVLHGGHSGEPDSGSARQPGESLEEYLARSRSETVERMRDRVRATAPPERLAKAHELLGRLLESAAEADRALAAQVAAYGCGDFQGSVSHGDRLQALVTESARLDRELILALEATEREEPGTLSELGIGGIGGPSTGSG